MHGPLRRGSACHRGANDIGCTNRRAQLYARHAFQRTIKAHLPFQISLPLISEVLRLCSDSHRDTLTANEPWTLSDDILKQDMARASKKSKTAQKAEKPGERRVRLLKIDANVSLQECGHLNPNDYSIENLCHNFDCKGEFINVFNLLCQRATSPYEPKIGMNCIVKAFVGVIGKKAGIAVSSPIYQRMRRCLTLEKIEGVLWNEWLDPCEIMAKAFLLHKRRGINLNSYNDNTASIPLIFSAIALLAETLEFALTICHEMFEVLKENDRLWYKSIFVYKPIVLAQTVEWIAVCPALYDYQGITLDHERYSKIHKFLDFSGGASDPLWNVGLLDATATCLQCSEHYDKYFEYRERLRNVILSFALYQNPLEELVAYTIARVVERTLGAWFRSDWIFSKAAKKLFECRTWRAFEEWCAENMVQSRAIMGKIFVVSNQPNQDESSILNDHAYVPLLAYQCGLLRKLSRECSWKEASNTGIPIIEGLMKLNKYWWEPRLPAGSPLLVIQLLQGIEALRALPTLASGYPHQ